MYRQSQGPLHDRFEISIRHMVAEWQEKVPENSPDRLQKGRMFVEAMGIGFLKELETRRDPTAALLAARQEKPKQMIWAAIDHLQSSNFKPDVKLAAFQALMLEASFSPSKSSTWAWKEAFDGANQDKKVSFCPWPIKCVHSIR